MMRWRLRVGAPVNRPFWGVELEPFSNGRIVRVSFWPNRWGFYVTWWQEMREVAERSEAKKTECWDCGGLPSNGERLCLRCDVARQS